MIKVNQEMYARAFKLMVADPVTAHDLVEEVGMHLVTASSLLRCFLKHKLIHVSAWEKDRRGRDVTPVYSFGSGRNKPRSRKSAADRQRESRERKKLAEFNHILIGGLHGNNESTPGDRGR